MDFKLINISLVLTIIVLFVFLGVTKRELFEDTACINNLAYNGLNLPIQKINPTYLKRLYQNCKDEESRFGYNFDNLIDKYPMLNNLKE